MKTPTGRSDCPFAERVLKSERPVLVLLNANHSSPALLTRLPGYIAQDLEDLAIFDPDPKDFAALSESSALCSQEGLALFNKGMLVYCFLGKPSDGDVSDLLGRARKLVELTRIPDLPVEQSE